LKKKALPIAISRPGLRVAVLFCDPMLTCRLVHTNIALLYDQRTISGAADNEGIGKPPDSRAGMDPCGLTPGRPIIRIVFDY
jgi:hypothetical protein